MTMLALTCLLAVWSAVCLTYARLLLAVWREPIFVRPTLVLESDDWGAGPTVQASALARLSDLLAGYRDGAGRPAVMTLGIVLQTADRDAMRAVGTAHHVALPLDDARLASVLAAIGRGVAAGVFVPQLHGLTHYWAPALEASAVDNATVRAWLAGAGPGWTEELPAALQSRWIDGHTLPSRALPPAEIANAIGTEIDEWQRIFAARPDVAVPTTFIWNDAVEHGYARAGVAVLITPGARYTGRDGAGRPQRSGPPVFNGTRGQGGIIYLVRDVYFEPVLEHQAGRLAEEVATRAALGRPALIEIHRFNFCGPRARDAAFDVLADGLRQLMAACEDLRFASSIELARAIEAHDPGWLETRSLRRCAMWARRALHLPGFGRAARACGLAWPLRALGAFA